MTAVSFLLLTFSGILLLGSLGEILFRRTGVPDAIWLILAGILLGPVGGTVDPVMLQRGAPSFAALTLIVILFEGGSRLELRALAQAAPRALLLALVGFAFSTAAVALLTVAAESAGLLPHEWTWQHGLLLGVILGGSSSIVIMPAVAVAGLDARLANLLSLESALTDVLCVVGAGAIIGLMAGPAVGRSAGVALATSFSAALFWGIAGGVVWLFALRALRGQAHAYPLTLAVLLLLYVLVEETGGSGALCVLGFAVVVGNAGAIWRAIGQEGSADLDSDVRGVHGQIAFIIKTFFFTFMGLMLGPPWELVAAGVVLALVLLLARGPAVWCATARGNYTAPERALLTMTLPRGMAAGVLATLPASRGVPGAAAYPTIVFACVLATVLIFAAGFPWARRGMRNRVVVPDSPPQSVV